MKRRLLILRFIKGIWASSVQDVQRWINQTCERYSENKARDFGIGKDDIDEIAQAAFTVGRMDNNQQSLVFRMLRQFY